MDQSFSIFFPLPPSCIFVEMLERTALFKSPHEDQPEGRIQQLLDIFAVCGTPTREDWPEAFELPGYKTVEFKPQASVLKKRLEKWGPNVFSVSYLSTCLTERFSG